MTIDTNFKTMTACAIEPVKAKMTDTESVTHLGVRIINDNLSTSCVLYWALMAADGTECLHGNAEITGNDYTNWSGDSLYPFAFVGALFNLTFI
jgi:hypothetical protein